MLTVISHCAFPLISAKCLCFPARFLNFETLDITLLIRFHKSNELHFHIAVCNFWLAISSNQPSVRYLKLTEEHKLSFGHKLGICKLEKQIFP